MKLKSFSKELPNSFKYFNFLVLLPILIWPLIFFMSVFIFDAPSSSSEIKNYILFFGMNSYPLILLLIAEINARVFIKLKYAAYILPLSSIILMFIGYLNIFGTDENYQSEFLSELEKKKEKGYIGFCDSYRIKNDSVFYKDFYLKKANYKTFFYLDCSLAKDNNFVFFGSDIIKDCDPKDDRNFFTKTRFSTVLITIRLKF